MQTRSFQPGKSGGERSNIDEKVRSAGVAVRLLGNLKENHRDDSLDSLQINPGLVAKMLTVSLEGLTSRAADALSRNPFVIGELPFHIGRKSGTPLTFNDLEIADDQPFQLSRLHVTIFVKNGRVGVSDRGSTLGGAVDERRFGGNSGFVGPVFFNDSGGVLVLGTAASPYRYKVTICERRD